MDRGSVVDRSERRTLARGRDLPHPGGVVVETRDARRGCSMPLTRLVTWRWKCDAPDTGLQVTYCPKHHVSLHVEEKEG